MAHHKLQPWLKIHLHSGTAWVKLFCQARSTSQNTNVGQFSSYFVKLEWIQKWGWWMHPAANANCKAPWMWGTLDVALYYTALIPSLITISLREENTEILSKTGQNPTMWIYTTMLHKRNLFNVDDWPKKIIIHSLVLKCTGHTLSSYS